MKAARTATLLVAFLLLPHAAVAQPAQTQPAPLRVYLECEPCSAELPRVAWLEWSDSATADVHVRVVVDPSGASGDSADHELAFSGRGEFAALNDVMRYPAPAGMEGGARHAALLHAVQLGLVRFVATTPLGAQLSIGLATDSAVARRPQPVQPVQGGGGRDGGGEGRAAREQKRWAAGVELGFSGSSGNSEFLALTSGVRVRHLQTNRFRLDWSASFRYGESAGAVAARHTQSKLDFDLGPGARFAPYISMSGERDPFRRIDLRGRGGTGVRLALHKDASGEAAVRAGVLYTHERFSAQAARQPQSDGLWSLKFTGNRQVFSSVRLENTSSFDPAVGNLGDYNLDVTSKLSTRITRRLALTVSHTYAYDATPVEGVEPTDQRFQTGLTLDF